MKTPMETAGPGCRARVHNLYCIFGTLVIILAAARFSMITIFDDAALFLISSGIPHGRTQVGRGRWPQGPKEATTRTSRRRRTSSGWPGSPLTPLFFSSSSSAPLILDDVGPASAPCKLPAADSSDEESEMPPDFLCPITMMPMQDSVMTYDGQTYERKLIEEWSCLASSEPDVEGLAVLCSSSYLVLCVPRTT